VGTAQPCGSHTKRFQDPTDVVLVGVAQAAQLGPVLLRQLHRGKRALEHRDFDERCSHVLLGVSGVVQLA
jgi:hypothetical protein